MICNGLTFDRMFCFQALKLETWDVANIYAMLVSEDVLDITDEFYEGLI